MLELKIKTETFLSKKALSTELIGKPGNVKQNSSPANNQSSWFRMIDAPNENSRWLVICEMGKTGAFQAMWMSTNGNVQIKRKGNKEPEHLIVITGEIQSCSIYAREINGDLELFHHNRECESEIGINDPTRNHENMETQLNLEGKPIFWTTEGDVIEELRSVNQLFDRDGKPLPTERGSIKIPEHIFYYNEDRRLTKLETINNKSVKEIYDENRRKTEVRKTLERDYTISIHWEDHIPFDNNWTTVMAKKQIKPTFATVFIAYDLLKGNWKFYSQAIEYESLTDKKRFSIYTKRSG